MRVNRRATLTTLAVVAIALTMLIGAAATAATPDFCDEASGRYNPDHPSCDTAPPDTTTTTAVPPLAACETKMTIEGKGSGGYECLWTPEKIGEEGHRVATVTVLTSEGLKKPPVVFVRDDSPGDICVLEQGWSSDDGPPYVAEFKLFYDTVPEGYDDWLGHSYWDFTYEADNLPTDPIIGAYWCSPQDFVLDSLRLDTNGTPLHLNVGFSFGKGGHLDITLSPGQESPTP